MGISVRDLSFSFSGRRVLEGLSLELEAGEMVFLLGPNGAGKSTLLRCILGRLKPEAGEICVGGHPLQSLGPRRRALLMSYIPQIIAPAFNVPVLQIVLMGRTAHLGLFSFPSPADRRIAMEALERVGMASLAEKGIMEISGGERQLVFIARALAQEAEIMILDEPAANLDYGNQIRVLEQLRGLCASGYLVLLSSHNPEHALFFGDRAAVMDEGRVVGLGPPAELITAEMIRRLYSVPVEIVEHHTGGDSIHLIAPRF